LNSRRVLRRTAYEYEAQSVSTRYFPFEKLVAVDFILAINRQNSVNET
jgi:hypothetical protein